ncbi:MAG: phoB [Gemmatimonadetes bacterium]|nr:phoB [Gemmatimonadota bacterium]
MQRIRAATAAVALVSEDPSLVDQVVSTVCDETTLAAVHTSFADLLASFATVSPDVVVLDDVSERDAAQEIRQLRRRQPSLHIVYVRVIDEKRSIALLHGGADDAIITGSPTLVARLQAATRRARTVNAGSRIAVGDIVFDREARRVWCAGREVALTPHEYGIVDCLFWHAPKPVGVDTLADFVWGDQSSTNKRTLVQVYVSYVRKKLAKSAKVAIRFARGAGYEFTPVEPEPTKPVVMGRAKRSAP